MDSWYDRAMNPPCLSGCFMFMRLSAISEHGIFFDDRFFMYFEDLDLIRRRQRSALNSIYLFRVLKFTTILKTAFVVSSL